MKLIKFGFFRLFLMVSLVLATMAGAGPALAVDTEPPVLQEAGLADIFGIRLIYDESLDTESIPDTGDFSVTVNGNPASVTGVGVTGEFMSFIDNWVTLSVIPFINEGDTVTISYTKGGNPIQDTSGNEAVSFADEPVSTDMTAPGLESAVLVDGSKVVLTYSEPLNETSVPDTVDFSARRNFLDPLNISGVSVSGTDVTVNLAVSLDPGDGIDISYSPGASQIMDLAGNAADGLMFESVKNDFIPPVLVSATIFANTVSLEYDKLLLGSDAFYSPDISNFAVFINDIEVEIASSYVPEDTVVLYLSEAAAEGDTVTLSYEPGSDPIQDYFENYAAALDNITVTNITPPADEYEPDNVYTDAGSITTDGTAQTHNIIIPGNQDWVSFTAVAGESYVIYIDESPDMDSVVSLYDTDGSTKLWEEDNGLAGDDEELGWTAAADGTYYIRVIHYDTDIGTGEYDISVTNVTPRVTGAVINGQTLVITYDREMDTNSDPDSIDFTVTINGVPMGVSAVDVNDHSVTLYLAGPAEAGDTVTVDYSPGLGPVLTAEGFPATGFTSQDADNTTSELNIIYDDADTDHVYFDQDTFSTILMGLDSYGIPDGNVRVAVGYMNQSGVPDFSESLLTGMIDAETYKYINDTVVGGSLAISGTINNPGNMGLPPGIVVFDVYSADGSQAYTADFPVTIQDSEGMTAFVGIQLPGADITASPSLSEVDDLYDTEQAITFSRAGVGSITFEPGLNIMDNHVQLEDLQISIVSGENDAYYVEVDTAVTTFLADQGASVTLFDIPFSEVDILCSNDSGLASNIQLDTASQTLTFDVNHFSRYTITEHPAGGGGGGGGGSAAETVDGLFTPGRDTDLSLGQEVTLKLTGDSFSEPVTVTLKFVTEAIPLPEDSVLQGQIIDVSTGDGQQPVKGVTLVFSYDETKVSEPRKLTAHYYNEETNEWELVGGKVNEAEGTFSVTISHFSKYALIESTNTFADISGHWAQNQIEILAGRRVIAGLNSTTFAPGATVTRAQFATLLVKALGFEPAPEKASFSDVNPSAWYAGNVGAAVEAGLINGYTDGTFKPNAFISREEAAVMIVRALETAGSEAGAGTGDITAEVSRFTDISEISSWSVSAVAAAVKEGIISGHPDGTFAPLQNCSRAEAAVMVLKMMGRAGLM